MLPICFTHGLALLPHYFKSSTCVCSVIFSLQRRCMGVLCCYFRPKMFSPGDHLQYHSRTLGAHVLAMCLMANCTSLVIYVRKSGCLRIWCLQRSQWLPPRQEQRPPPQPRAKPAAKRTGLAVQAGAKAAAKLAPRAIASSSSAKCNTPRACHAN